jgi:hypothetical protein
MPHFSGFRSCDFDGIAGTSWRGREGLGGVLSNMLTRETGLRFQSWGVARWQQLHVACPKNYKYDDPWRVAKLFVDTYGKRDEELRYGLYLETAHKGSGKVSEHWRNFRDRLRRGSEMRKSLRSAMTDHNLSVIQYEDPECDHPGCLFECRDGRFFRLESGPRKEANFDDLVARIAELPGHKWVNFYILQSMEMSKAIKLKSHIAGVISNLFTALVPVYLKTIA